ncbi:hypothetical protein Hanom_Chr07g00632861 [Helianthus anomalus]
MNHELWMRRKTNFELKNVASLLTCIANVSEEALWYFSSCFPTFWAEIHKSLVSSGVRSTNRFTSRLGQTSTCSLLLRQPNFRCPRGNL